MRRLLQAAIIVAIAAHTAAASPSSIGVFFTPDATDCDATVPYATIFDIYVVALPGTDAANGGMQGAEFRLDGIDPNWFPMVTANPSASATFGSLFSDAAIAFETCQGPWPVLLYTVRCIMATQPAPRVLSIQRPTTPNDHNWAPVLALCDPPIYTKISVTGGRAFLNGGTCTVGAESNTWSALKNIFR